MSGQLIAIIILLILSGLFSATETSYTSLSLLQKNTLEKSESKRAKMAARLANNPDTLLTTILIGNNVVNLTASSLVTSFTIEALGNEFVGYATGIITILVLIFGEITPKQIALIHNVQIATAMSYPVRFLTIVLFPVVWVFRLISRSVTRLFSKGRKMNQISLEGIMHIMNVAEDEGVLEEYETDMVQRVLHFDDTQVKTIMTHRSKVFRLPDYISLEEAYPKIVESGFSRIPVYSDNPDEITGVLLLRDLLKAQVDKRIDEPLSSFAHKALFIPETCHVDDVFSLFKNKKFNQAVIVDEYGMFSGIVTMEDVIEQLFGELYDEHESGTEERVKKLADRPDSYLVQADTPFQELVDDLDLSWPHAEKYGTVAAFLMEYTEAILREEEVIATPVGAFHVARMEGRCAKEVIFTPSRKA